MFGLTMMDKNALFLVILLFLSPKVHSRSYNQNYLSKGWDERIVFEDYKESRMHHDIGNPEDSNEWEHDDGNRGYKHQRNWNPDRVWFPDFDRFLTSPPSTSVKQVVTTVSPTTNVYECINQCRTTSEYNPVCGTNRVTYYNIGRLECARVCGADVNVYRNEPCTLVQEPSEPSENTPTVAEVQRQCMQSCPITPEYNPICGTNNLTYQNRGQLECAKYCGIDVEVKRLSPCPKLITTESPITDDFTSKDQISWGSKNVFTQSTEAPDKLNFTIPQEILNNIFNIPTDSNEVDIDIRQGQQ